MKSTVFVQDNFLVPFGLPSRNLDSEWTYWALAFVCFRFFFTTFFNFWL